MVTHCGNTINVITDVMAPVMVPLGPQARLPLDRRTHAHIHTHTRTHTHTREERGWERQGAIATTVK